MKLPLNNPKITSPYGIERTINGVKSVHKGIDLISTSGDREVKSIGDGVVRGNFNDPNGFGNYVSIEHADGKRVIYAHLASFKKKKGDVVKAGDVIGIEGTTGRSTGLHLHLEVREKPYSQNNRINIADYLGIENKVGLVKEKEMEVNIMLEKFVEKYTAEVVEKGLDILFASVSDDGLPSEWAEKEFQEAKKLGITDGKNPEMFATRQEVAIMVKRATKMSHQN